jgi:hypothetical protein
MTKDQIRMTKEIQKTNYKGGNLPFELSALDFCLSLDIRILVFGFAP